VTQHKLRSESEESNIWRPDDYAAVSLTEPLPDRVSVTFPDLRRSIAQVNHRVPGWQDISTDPPPPRLSAYLSSSHALTPSLPAHHNHHFLFCIYFLSARASLGRALHYSSLSLSTMKTRLKRHPAIPLYSSTFAATSPLPEANITPMRSSLHLIVPFASFHKYLRYTIDLRTTFLTNGFPTARVGVGFPAGARPHRLRRDGP
jgi:hypothetical protein